MKKKLKLEGKNMLNKEQLREVKGGDYGCPYYACFCETGTGSVVFIGCHGPLDCKIQCSYIFPPWGI